ncbi:MAG: GNAT family N-acetyltransferase [Rhodocyclaceae bacterium]|nr:GNAT family N-acetyltransferase [Rhodocyclaceae bacterium]
MAPELILRAMTRAELDTLVDWAAAEGWNPGRADAEIFWQTDPEAFIAAEQGGELVGGGSIVSYAGRYGFMGFFIMRPDHRSRGLGRKLWLHRRDRLLARLAAGAAIGMDGVFAMQAFYARGGFTLSHRDLRYQGLGAAAAAQPGLVDLHDIAFDALLRYDAAHFGVARERFLRAWIAQREARAWGAVTAAGSLCGYGLVRACRQGCKIGPLFAADAATADKLYRALAAYMPGQPVYLDVPENNPQALALARAHGLREVFGCARMYHGAPPQIPAQEIYGVTTFELG